MCWTDGSPIIWPRSLPRPIRLPGRRRPLPKRRQSISFSSCGPIAAPSPSPSTRSVDTERQSKCSAGFLPRQNPWSRFRQPDGYDGLLHEMFRILSRIVLLGLVLTQVSRARPIAAEESKGLEEEEAYLQSMLAPVGSILFPPTARA